MDGGQEFFFLSAENFRVYKKSIRIDRNADGFWQCDVHVSDETEDAYPCLACRDLGAHHVEFHVAYEDAEFFIGDLPVAAALDVAEESLADGRVGADVPLAQEEPHAEADESDGPDDAPHADVKNPADEEKASDDDEENAERDLSFVSHFSSFDPIDVKMILVMHILKNGCPMTV